MPRLLDNKKVCPSFSASHRLRVAVLTFISCVGAYTTSYLPLGNDWGARGRRGRGNKRGCPPSNGAYPPVSPGMSLVVSPALLAFLSTNFPFPCRTQPPPPPWPHPPRHPPPPPPPSSARTRPPCRRERCRADQLQRTWTCGYASAERSVVCTLYHPTILYLSGQILPQEDRLTQPHRRSRYGRGHPPF